MTATTEGPDAPDPDVAVVGDGLLELMRDAFRGVPLHDVVGIDLREVGNGRAAVEIPLADGALSSFGTLHGGAIAVLFDVTCAAAASTDPSIDHSTHTLVTSDLHVRYLGRARGERVRAEARVVKAGRALVVLAAELTDDGGGLIATADMAMSLVAHRAPQAGPAGDRARVA